MGTAPWLDFINILKIRWLSVQIQVLEPCLLKQANDTQTFDTMCVVKQKFPLSIIFQ